jgi:hypothetical protein
VSPLLLGLLGLLGSLGCGSPPGAALDSATPETTPVVGRLTWALDWDTSGVDLHDDGTWVVVSAEGRVLHVQGGALVSYAVHLDPCEGPGDAAAGKHIDLSNGSFPGGWVEPLVPLQAHVFDGLAPGFAACAAGYAIARADGTTRGDRDAVAEHSLVLVGTLDGEPVDLRSTLMTGREQRFEAGLPSDTALRVVRDAATLIDGLDPADQDEAAQGLRLLVNLAEGARFELE